MTEPQPRKRILILAGPNGAGKTTFAREFLPNEAQCPTFVNADLIAAGLSPFNPEAAAMRAGRLMVQLIAEHVTRGDSFAFETTLADKSYARHIPGWRASGYHVSLIFLSLGSPELAIRRVVERVAQGGHFVPESIVRRRFLAGGTNFEGTHKPLVDTWANYDNSGNAPALLDSNEQHAKPIEQAKSSDIALALPALLRARKRAEEIARATSTALIQLENGQVARVLPAATREPETAK